MAEQRVYKVKLGSGKEVVLRELKIKHQELAARAVGKRCDDSPNAFQFAFQTELLKILIISVKDKDAADAVPYEGNKHLDDLFSMSEYTQLTKVLGKLVEGEGADADPLIEDVSSGSK